MTARSHADPGGTAAFDVERLLACPLCKAALEISQRTTQCTGCGTVFPRTRTDCHELLPPQGAGEAPTWNQRQHTMEAWYRDMVSTDWAHTCFENDYEPLRPFLSRYRGTILDLGGGAGVTRRYLAANVRYVSVDPSLMWLGSEWTPFTSSSQPLADCVFVQGTGEQLPVASRAVDAVLALWSMNHVSDPARVFDEVRRVLRPGGRFLVVPEDVEPRWTDLFTRWFARGGWRGLPGEFAEKLRSTLPWGEWTLQPDHIRITEADLRVWSATGFMLGRRAWVEDYLVLEYVRTDEAQ